MTMKKIKVDLDCCSPPEVGTWIIHEIGFFMLNMNRIHFPICISIYIYMRYDMI